MTVEGERLGSIDLKEPGDVAEMRGVVRRELLQRLYDALPADTVQFSSFVTSVNLTEQSAMVLLLAAQ